MFVRWCLTVLTLIANFCAMSTLGYPATTVATISSSREVRPNVGRSASAAGSAARLRMLSIRSPTHSRPTQYWPAITVDTLEHELARRLFHHDAARAELQRFDYVGVADFGRHEQRARRAVHRRQLAKRVEPGRHR